MRVTTHDQLVVALSGGLTDRTIKVHTSRSLAKSDSAAVRLVLEENQAEIDLPVTVVEVPDTGEPPVKPWARLRFDAQCRRLLEAFVLQHDPSSEASGIRRDRASLKIAVIDDSESQRELAARPFRDRGHEVLEAADGLQGLALCLQHEPDAILSDLQMPKIDGWQLLRMLRARKKFARTPVLFLTTLSAEKDRLHGYRLGVDDYVEKPFSEADLVARVERAIRRSVVSLRPQRAVDGLRGSLEHVGLPALLSFLELERKTGSLRLQPEGCLVVLRQGRPISARGPNLDSQQSGAEALFELLDHAAGTFEFIPGPQNDPDSIRASLSMLLMEHARRTDEAAAKSETA